MGKRSFLIGGENAHIFPVVSELSTTVQADDISAGCRGGITAAMSRLAGLGKANLFVPASEQSV